MKPLHFFALLISLALPSLAIGQTLSTEEALSLSKMTGRPILAMAGRAT